MHFYFITRGLKKEVDQFITELQGKYLPIKLKIKDGQIDKDGVEANMQVAVGVKPIQLWEVNFPKEHKDLMLTTILKGGIGTRNERAYNWMRKVFAPLRTLLGLKKVGKYDSSKVFPISHEALDIVAIGIKEDKEYEWGEGI